MKRRHDKENLYNLAEHKTRRTIAYVNRLEPKLSWELTELKKFNKIIAEALGKATANEMLDVIGFNQTGTDGVYDYIDKIAERKAKEKVKKDD